MNFVTLLASEYNLTVTDVRQIEGIAMNAVYIADKQFFIKAVAKNRPTNEEIYAARLQLLHDLAKAGVPVPDLIKTNNSRLYVPTNDHFIEVYKFIPNGEFYTGQPHQVAQIAQAMAHFHNVADTLNDKSHQRLIAQTAPPFGTAKPLDADEIGEYRSLAYKLPENARGFILYCLSVLEERTEEILRQIAQIRIRAEDIGIVHGDLHDQNVIMNKDTKALKALVDWECTHGRSRSFDLAYTLERLAVIPSPSHLYNPLFPFEQIDFDKSKIDEFLDAYSRIRTIPGTLKQECVAELQMEAVARSSNFLRTKFRDLKEERPVNVNQWHIFLRIQTPIRFDTLEKLL